MKLLALACLAVFAALSPASAQSGSMADMETLEQSAITFVKAFNKGDAETISNLFVPDGEVVLDTGALISGRKALQDHYTNVFSAPSRPEAALETNSVRFISPEVAVEDGTVHLTYASGEISSHHFTSVHLRQEDGSWLYASVRDETGDHALPNEKLLALQWIIGDWVMQTQEGDTWISFNWSESGPYIDAKALTQAAGIRSTAATFRVGWNEHTESFNSWAFDDEGGFNHSNWTMSGPNRWILKTNGITAAGETNNATQIFEVDSSGESFTWSKRDQIIAGEVQPSQMLKAVKRPPHPSTASTETK